jgi:hypothetical protein
MRQDRAPPLTEWELRSGYKSYYGCGKHIIGFDLSLQVVSTFTVCTRAGTRNPALQLLHQGNECTSV